MISRNNHLSAEEVRGLLDYDPETGFFRWKDRPASDFASERLHNAFTSRFAGKSAGAVARTGYITICINYRAYLAHRLAWLYVTGEWPECQIDHIDRKRANNCFSNLREASAEENRRNLSIRTTNKSGVTGVHQSYVGPGSRNRTKKWIAQISVKGAPTIHLGTFETKAEAIAARITAEKRFHGEFACNSQAQ